MGAAAPVSRVALNLHLSNAPLGKAGNGAWRSEMSHLSV
jgi:hypothetical protein